MTLRLAQSPSASSAASKRPATVFEVFVIRHPKTGAAHEFLVVREAGDDLDFLKECAAAEAAEQWRVSEAELGAYYNRTIYRRNNE